MIVNEHGKPWDELDMAVARYSLRHHGIDPERDFWSLYTTNGFPIAGCVPITKNGPCHTFVCMKFEYRN